MTTDIKKLLDEFNNCDCKSCMESRQQILTAFDVKQLENIKGQSVVKDLKEYNQTLQSRLDRALPWLEWLNAHIVPPQVEELQALIEECKNAVPKG